MSSFYPCATELALKYHMNRNEPCPTCHRTHESDMAQAISRFRSWPSTFRARYDGAPTRARRVEAEQDMCQHWAETRTEQAAHLRKFYA